MTCRRKRRGTHKRKAKKHAAERAAQMLLEASDPNLYTFRDLISSAGLLKAMSKQFNQAVPKLSALGKKL